MSPIFIEKINTSKYPILKYIKQNQDNHHQLTPNSSNKLKLSTLPKIYLNLDKMSKKTLFSVTLQNWFKVKN